MLLPRRHFSNALRTTRSTFCTFGGIGFSEDDGKTSRSKALTSASST